MLIIRLTRVGKKNSPSFRVVLTERQNPIKGKFIEILGHYNPRAKALDFKKERILYWISKGAQCSATVHNLLVSEKIIEGPKQKAWHAKKPAHPSAGEAGSPAGPDNVAGKSASALSSANAAEGKKATEDNSVSAEVAKSEEKPEEKAEEGGKPEKAPEKTPEAKKPIEKEAPKKESKEQEKPAQKEAAGPEKRPEDKPKEQKEPAEPPKDKEKPKQEPAGEKDKEKSPEK